jgi:DNA-binding response OmpR family regulator
MKTILVIDDNEAICETLEIFFKKKGFNVLTAGDGNRGIALLNDNHVDLLILDMIMPEKDGVETLLDLKKFSSKIPIIAISGGGSIPPEFFLKTAKELGVKETFRKPFDRNALLLSVNEALKDIED